MGIFLIDGNKDRDEILLTIEALREGRVTLTEAQIKIKRHAQKLAVRTDPFLSSISRLLKAERYDMAKKITFAITPVHPRSWIIWAVTLFIIILAVLIFKIIWLALGIFF